MGLHRADGHIQMFRNALVGPLLMYGQPNHLLLLDPQPAELGHRGAGLFILFQPLQRLRLARDRFVTDAARAVAVDPLTNPPPINEPPTGDGRHKRARRSDGGIKPRGNAPDLSENVLHRVLSVRPICEQLAGKRPDKWTEAVDARPEDV